MDMRLLAELIDEAAKIVEGLPAEVAEKLQVRAFLADELHGSALMLRDEAAEKPSDNVTKCPVTARKELETQQLQRRPDDSVAQRRGSDDSWIHGVDD